MSHVYPADLKYCKTHEWVKVSGQKAKIGITAYAIEQLTDLTYLDLKVRVGAKVNAGTSIGGVESVKTFSEIYTPVSGKVVGVHKELPDKLTTLMKEPYNSWMVEIEISNPQELNSLMDAGGYAKHVASEAHH